MALSTEFPRPFRLYVTHVDGEGHFLKISGQLDKQSAIMIEHLFKTALENLEKGVGAVNPAAIQEGLICAAKYKDGSYYRAKIVNTADIMSGMVGVHFIDFGNKDIISLSAIRFLDSYDPLFLQLRGQATDYYLSRLIHPSGQWDEQLVMKVQYMLCYAEYPAAVEAQTKTLPIIGIQYQGKDLSSYLSVNRYGVEFPVQKQEMLLAQIAGAISPPTNWPSQSNEAPYQEHIPFLVNQNFPSNPASAMRLQQNPVLPFNGSVPPPSLISQRLKVSRTANVKAPMRQPQQTSPTSLVTSPTTPPQPPQVSKPMFTDKSTTFKSRLLEVGSQHNVLVSFSEKGPEVFAVQLVIDASKLQEMMDEINRRPHSSLTEPPMIGTVCLGRMSGDRIICRAVVMNLSGSQCQLYFVDFGDTEMVSYYDIFDIPEEFVKPNVFALRFCLSGVRKLEVGQHMTDTFKKLVIGKVMTLRVVPPEGPPLMQYGELYLDGLNVFDLLQSSLTDKLQFKYMEMLPLGSRQSVMCSYVDSCIKFYVQLTDKIDELNVVMDEVKAHCENSKAPGELPVGAACCALFPEDSSWYRARVLGSNGSNRVVSYVDYGNEQEVSLSDLRTITPQLIRLPAQALKCALKGFENKPIEVKSSNQLEMLALEKTLTAHIVGVLSSDTMLVSLINETETPPLDVARKMIELSAPQSQRTSAGKPTTSARKEAPESFSSPEGSEKKGYRREKSFKEEKERWPKEGNEEFGHRGGSFRSRDNNEGFDRSAPGRHSDKFGRESRPERGDRRAPKPWEKDPAPADVALPAGNDEWEETPVQQNTYQRPSNRDGRDNNRDGRDNNRDGRDNNRDGRDNNRNDRDNRDRRKARLEPPTRAAGWKGRDPVSKRRPDQTQDSTGFSVQDRLKRDNKFNNQEEKRDDWGKKRSFEDRPDRRGDRRDNWGDRKDNFGERKENYGERKENYGERKDNYGERRDNYGERKENYGERKENYGERKDNYGERKDFQKREFRDNNRERGDRPRSNFNPRDRADRSFGSNKSDTGSQDGERAGRAPPYKSRSKFTAVQYKELSDPVSLETPFEEPVVDTGAQHEVSVTWIISPESFYTQILTSQPNFLEMMHKIPELYKGVKSYTGLVPVGASVLARYPADGVLYRATVVAVQPFSKFIVRYIDFGNKQLVDAKDIWQLDRQLMELPKMAVHCSLLGVAPKEGEWKPNPEIDLCFNAPRYQCVFQECRDEQWKVYLYNNGVNVADTLVEKELAVMSDHQSSVALKDEAIDLTIIVGQQILCKVTHVESFDKFFIQLDLEKAALVEEAIANYDATKLTPLAAESLSEGVHCTVRYDNKICRAILNDVTDKDNIQAVLPDYGNTITTSMDNLMILPTELTVYYYQSLLCTLHNYTVESKTLVTEDELRTRLQGNKFIIYINDVDGITLVSTLYDIPTGHKVPLFEPDEGAYEEVIQLCTRAVFNYNFGLAYISHAQTLNELYLQKSSDRDPIAKLLDDMYTFYEEGTPEPLSSFEVDGLCAAKSSDGNWYRATIISAEDEVNVHFTDYGNTETVPKDSIKVLDPKLFEPCALALVASLGLVALQEDAVTKLVEWTSDKELQVTLACGAEGWLASLHLDGVDLAMKLVNEKLATPHVVATEETKEEAPIEEPVSLPPGCTQAYVSHIDTPGHFWIQMSDMVDAIDLIQAELQAEADGYTDIENREMGTLCIAKYLADDQWYRAEILDADADITTVRFIDYGNTDVLDNKPGLIKTIPDKYKDVERYAVKSSVNAIPSGTGEWSEEATEYFTELVGDISVPLETLIVLKDVTTYVDLFVSGQNLTDKLVSRGYATKSEATECGDLPTCFASHVNSPSEFWIQLETAAPELQAMESVMIDAENFPELTDKNEGVLCAAKYPEDGAWYRAQVIVDGSEGTEVLFMDYGNASIAHELRSLPDELKTKPALSRKCALQKPRDIKSWSRKSEEKFNELAAEGATIFNVQFIASGDISIVELLLEGKSVTEELVSLCEEQPIVERPTPVGQDLLSSGKICYVKSLDEFYFQEDRSVADVYSITERLSNAAEFEPVSELKVGSICAAFWNEDEQWYRARVLEFCDVGYHVQFLDFGNKAKCEEFKQLPEDVAAIEPCVKCCRLAGVDAKNENAKLKLDELAANADLTFQIEFLDNTKEPALVKLVLDGKDVSSILADSITEVVIPETNETEVVIPETNEAEVVIPETNETEAAQTDNSTLTNEEAVIKEETITESLFVKTLQVEAESLPIEAEISSAHTDSLALNTESLPVETEPSSANTYPLAVEIKSLSINTKSPAVEIAASSVETIEPVIEETSIVKEIEMLTLDAEKPTKANYEIGHTDPEDADEVEDKMADDSCSELNTSKDFNESMESSSTVIENKSFESKADNSSDDFKDAENESTETLENSNNSNNTIKTPERDSSKDSLNTDTGYTSEHVDDKLSPLKDENGTEKNSTKLEEPSHVDVKVVQEETIKESAEKKTEELAASKTEELSETVKNEVGKGDAPEATNQPNNGAKEAKPAKEAERDLNQTI